MTRKYPPHTAQEWWLQERDNQLALAQGYATGHGDTVEDLLQELERQVRESERESCAKVCDEAKAARLAEVIRARGNT